MTAHPLLASRIASGLRPWRVIALAVLACTAALPARALRLDGIEFADRISLAGQTLQINGAGFRAVALFKGYAAALYVVERSDQAAALAASPGAKRVQMRMLVDVPAPEFVKALHKGVARNTPAAEAAALAERMARFDAQIRALGTLHRGDIVDLDFLPGRGLQLSLNGQPKGAPLEGEDLYAAVLRIFIGPRPVDQALKQGLLGVAAR